MTGLGCDAFVIAGIEEIGTRPVLGQAVLCDPFGEHALAQLAGAARGQGDGAKARGQRGGEDGQGNQHFEQRKA